MSYKTGQESSWAGYKVEICDLSFKNTKDQSTIAGDFNSLCVFCMSCLSTKRHTEMMESFTILTPNAMLGYGYRQDHFWYGIEHYKPAAIIVDSGSTDAGPFKLGMGKMTCGRESYIRDLTSMLEACFYRKIKVLIGSAGGDGSNRHVREMLSFVEEIAAARGFTFKIATVENDLGRPWIRQKLTEGKSSPCGPLEPLKLEDVDEAVDIVGQMGAEP